MRRGAVLVAAVILTVALAGCDWSQYRFGPAHTGFNPGEPGLTVDTVQGEATATWIGALDGQTFAPVVANGVVYVSQRVGGLFAFDATGTPDCTGVNVATPCAPLWSATAGQETFSSPVVADGRVYLGSTDGNLYVFDAAGVENCGGTPKTCAPLWKDQLDITPLDVRIPTVTNGRVYVGGGGPGFLFVFSTDGTDNCSGTPKTCTPLWTADVGGSIDEAPTVAGGRVFVGSSDHNLYAFDAAGVTNCSFGSCRPLWIGPTGAPINTTPAASGGRVFVSSDDGNLYAFAEGGGPNCSGKNVCLPLWRAAVANDFETSPAVANGHVYVNGNGVLNVYDAAGITNCTGTPARCTPLWTSTGDEPTSSPVVAGGMVFVGTGNFHVPSLEVSGFDAQGVECTCARWQGQNIVGVVRTSPAVANGWLYVTDDTNLYAFALV